MKYYTNTYSGVDNIFDEILDKNNKDSFENSDFVYIQKYNLLKNKNLENIKYFNNFIDPHKRLCQTGNYCLGNKSEFYNYFIKYYNKRPEYIPITYSFNNKNFREFEYLFDSPKVWIIKPTNSYARKGINVINNYSDLTNTLINYPRFNNWVIQEYVKNPFLYNGKKFHIRFYCLAIKDKNNFKSYIYKDGFMYLASMPFDINDLNLSRHMTGAKYCLVHQIYPDLQKYLTSNQFNKVLEQAQKIIIDTMSICKEILKCPNKNKIITNGKCFHLFAFDLLPDKNLKLHLLEVNNGTVGMETSHHRPDICLGKKNKKLHNLNIIRNLHKDLVNLVVNNTTNNFKEIKLNNFKSNIIEHFDVKNSNNKNIIILCMIIIILFIILKKFIIF